MDHKTFRSLWWNLHWNRDHDELARKLKRWSHLSIDEIVDPEHGVPLLHVLSTNVTDLSWLLNRYKCTVNITDRVGRTALSYQCQTLDVITLLVSHGIDVNIRDKRGNTAVMLYANWGRLDRVTFLLDHGASISEAFIAYVNSGKVNTTGMTRLRLYFTRAERCEKVAMVFVALGKKRHVLQLDVAKLLGQYIWSTRRNEEWDP
jgi:ankyrin repeat protein